MSITKSIQLEMHAPLWYKCHKCCRFYLDFNLFQPDSLHRCHSHHTFILKMLKKKKKSRHMTAKRNVGKVWILFYKVCVREHWTIGLLLDNNDQPLNAFNGWIPSRCHNVQTVSCLCCIQSGPEEQLQLFVQLTRNSSTTYDKTSDGGILFHYWEQRCGGLCNSYCYGCSYVCYLFLVCGSNSRRINKRKCGPRFDLDFDFLNSNRQWLPVAT